MTMNQTQLKKESRDDADEQAAKLSQRSEADRERTRKLLEENDDLMAEIDALLDEETVQIAAKFTQAGGQ